MIVVGLKCETCGIVYSVRDFEPSLMDDMLEGFATRQGGENKEKCIDCIIDDKFPVKSVPVDGQ